MMLSLSITRWKLLRRLLKAGRKGGTFKELRSWVRLDKDQKDFDTLVELGLVTLEGDIYRITDAGRDAADMGEYTPGK